MTRPDAPPRGGPLGRALVAAALVGSTISLGHHLLPGAPWWPLVYIAIPALVFSHGALSSGRSLRSPGVLVRGLATVAAVALAFSFVNGFGGLPAWGRIALNFVIPFTVSNLGAVGSVVSPRQPTS